MRFPITLLLCSLAIGGAFATGCDTFRPIEEICEKRLGATEIRVKAAPVDYTTDFTLPGSELTRMAAAEHGRFVNGLTHTSMTSSVSVNSRGITMRGSGKHCLRPTIDVQLAFAPMTVYVSSDNPEGSCQFGVTMQHELQHVATFRDFLDEAAPEVESELRKYFGNRIFYFASEADASRRMAEEAKERVGPFVEQSMSRVGELQARHDTREEYDRLQRACPGTG